MLYGTMYVENEKKGKKMLILNLERVTTDDCFGDVLDVQWKLSCGDGLTISPTGEYITMKKVDPTHNRIIENNDIFEIFSTMCLLIRDEVEAVWDERTNILTFNNGWFFEFY